MKYLGQTIVEVAVATRKMLFCYSELCGMASDAVGAVRSAIAQLRLNCLDVCIPGAIDAILHGLVGRTQVRIDLKGPFRLL